MAAIDVSSPAGLNELNDKLLEQPYISGFQASMDDVTVFAGMPEAPDAKFTNLARWHTHVKALVIKRWVAALLSRVVSASHSDRVFEQE